MDRLTRWLARPWLKRKLCRYIEAETRARVNPSSEASRELRAAAEALAPSYNRMAGHPFAFAVWQLERIQRQSGVDLDEADAHFKQNSNSTKSSPEQ